MKPFKFINRLNACFTGDSTISRFIIFSILFIIWGSGTDADASWFYRDPVLPPIAICKNILVQLGPAGSITISGSDVDGGSYDPDGTITSRTVSPATFTCSQTGSNTVILTVTDNEGLISTCTATVTVEDRISPVMICRNRTVYLDASGNGTITPADLNNGSSDNCPSGLFLYISRTIFSCSDIGSPVNVTLTGTDASGNSSSCISQVTVLDTVSPVVNTKAFNLVLGSGGTATLNPSDVDNGSYDNCGNVFLSVFPETYSCNDLGQKTVTLTALDSHGNSTSRNVTISVSSTLKITGMMLSSCNLSQALALYEPEVEGGDGSYAFYWRGLDPAAKPFMTIILLPPSLQFWNSSILENPFFNSTMPMGYYDIRLVVTDGNGCTDSSDMTINHTGVLFNNQTLRYSKACEGEIKTYSVNYESDATYSWSVTNGTILSGDTDTSRVNIMWNLGVVQGRVLTTITKPNPLFPGGQCESAEIDTVTITPAPVPAFNNPVLDACSNTVSIYTLTGSYAYQGWTVTGGTITAGGKISDNFVAVRWGNGPSGTVSVSVGSDPLCTGSVTVNVTVFNLSGAITSLSDITCNGVSDGSVTVAADPGTGLAPYVYSLDGGVYQSGGTFTGIPLGNHIVRIRDAMLCTFDLQFVINQQLPVFGSTSAQANVSCFGGNDGSVTIVASGGEAPYQFRLDAGPLQSSNIFGGLAAGSYLITIQDSHGCTGTIPFTITQPPIALNGSVSVTDIACYGESTGRADLTVTGGTPQYSYLWSNGAMVEDIVNLAAGSYSVVITDANGCNATVSATVSQPASAISVTASITDVLCHGFTTGAIDITVTGGVSPYSIVWTNGATAEDLINLPAGSYSAIITDSNECIYSLAVSVGQPSSSVGGSVIAQNNVSCFGGNNGTFTVSGSGGSGSLEYQLNTGPFQSSGTFGSLTAGTYNITIRDANMCTFVLPVIITEPSAPLIGNIVSKTDVRCFGETNGSVTVLGSGGTPPYTYSANGGSFQISGLFENLGAGTNNVTVRDFNLCQFVMQVIIVQPDSPLTVAISSTNVLCSGGTSGTATALPSGGTSPYTYLWSTVPPQTAAMAINLPEGIYSVKVTDNNGCVSSGAATITQPSVALTATLAVTDVSCNSGSDGSINLTVSNGTLPITFIWSNGAVTEDLSGLTAGLYSVLVTDANGCTASSSATINQPAVLSASVNVTDVLCFGGNTGSCDLTIAGGTPPYTFLWNTGSVAEDIGSLSAGNYSVTVTDSHGCTAIVNTLVAQPAAALTGSVTSQTNVSVYGGNDGSVTISGAGGSLPYQYRLNGGSYQASGTFGTLTAGSYTITVQDAGMCTFDVPVTITQPSIPLTANIISQTNVTCYGGANGSVTVTGLGGTSPYVYSYNGGTFGNSDTFSSLSAGIDTITVRDASMNIFDLIIEITEPDKLDVAVSGEDVHCFGGATGTVTAAVLGGTAPYSYLWDTTPAQTTASASGLIAGTYTVSVTDANGCIAANNATILQPGIDMNISISSVNVLCAGGESGSATAQVEGGLAPYTFSWNTVPEQTKESATDLSAGDYTVTVTDSYGCVKTASVNLTEPQGISIEAFTNVASCPDSDDGAITLTVTGGQSPYNALWSDGITTQNRSKVKPGTYSVIITDQNACAKSLVIEVVYTWTFNCVVIPQVITPNNDGFNDEWIIKNIDLYPNAEIHVYNRWGKLVFSTKNLSDNPWDGRLDGKLVPTDSYHYILYLNDGSEPRSGVISVIR